MSFAKATIYGNMTRDPELKYTQGSTAFCNFTLGVNRKYKKGDQNVEKPSFIDCTAWGRTAEVICEYLAKGRSVIVIGDIDQQTWEDKATGGKRSKLNINVEKIEMLPKAGGNGSGGSNGSNQGGTRQQQAKPTESSGDDFSGDFSDGMGEDDVPF